MRQLTILIDMDDVIEQLLHAWISYLNDKHNLDVKMSDVTSYDMRETFTSLTEEEIFAPLSLECFWETVKPVPGAVDTIRKLIEDGHNVYIVTASAPHTIKIKLEKVLFKYFPFISYKNVIVAHKKQMIKGDVLIDDAPFNLVGGDYRKLLMDSPHNAQFKCDGEDAPIRVYNWGQIYDYMYALSNEDNN